MFCWEAMTHEFRQTEWNRGAHWSYLVILYAKSAVLWPLVGAMWDVNGLILISYTSCSTMCLAHVTKYMHRLVVEIRAWMLLEPYMERLCYLVGLQQSEVIRASVYPSVCHPISWYPLLHCLSCLATSGCPLFPSLPTHTNTPTVYCIHRFISPPSTNT